jgi:hypothetical protein
MPAKGPYSALTDLEVSPAVAYLYQTGMEILAKEDNTIMREGCDPVSNLDQCSQEELKKLMILRMLWLLLGVASNSDSRSPWRPIPLSRVRNLCKFIRTDSSAAVITARSKAVLNCGVGFVVADSCQTGSPRQHEFLRPGYYDNGPEERRR